ncbi:MAG: HAMP domain-containing protein [Alphaproteobacteria bacterium]|nr:HAMP domain-containing protein [Alphaproteobacteria bacterium]
MGVALVHAVLMTFFVLDLVGRQRSFLQEQRYDQAFSLTKTLAANSTSWVLSDDLVGLEELLKPMSDYPELRYAMVLSDDGQVLAHTKTGVAGRYIADSVSTRLLIAPPKPTELVNTPEIVDVASPILIDDRLIGWARIGLGQEASGRELRLVTIEGLIYTLFAIVLGTLFAFWMARGLTSGLYGLKSVADSFSKGDRDLRASSDRHDEIGELAIGFNQMLDAIAINESDLRQTLDALSRSNVELERFAHIAAHDLQEPTRSLILHTQLLKKRLGEGLGDEDSKSLDYIIQCAQHMQSLVRDILLFSRTSHTQGLLEDVDMQDVLTMALTNLDLTISEREAVISYGDLPHVSANRGQLILLVQNLISNAIKFTSRDVKPRIAISARRDGEFWEFSVTDNGIGIDPQYFNLIFQLFKRLHTHDSYPGTGIGLALCKRIVELNGGKIWVHSESGKGSVFYFTLRAL